MDKNIPKTDVAVIRDEAGVFRPSNPFTRLLDCSATFLGNELLRIGPEDDNCMTYEEGSVAPYVSANTVNTAKLRTDKGTIHITPASYASFITECNACCNP